VASDGRATDGLVEARELWQSQCGTAGVPREIALRSRGPRNRAAQL